MFNNYKKSKASKNSKLPKFGTGDIYNENRESDIYAKGENPNTNASTGQYMAAAGALAASGNNMYQTYNDPMATNRNKADSFDNTARGVTGAINPVIGAGIGLGDMIGKPIRSSLEKTDPVTGEVKNRFAVKAGAVAGMLFDPGKWIGHIANGGLNDLSGNKYVDDIEANAKSNMFPNGGINMQPNAEVEKQENTLNPDGSTTQFDGPAHEQGGIPTKLDPNTLVFSDKLKLQGKTFADHNKVNSTDKEDKILANKKISGSSKETAELMKQAKIKNSMSLFQMQQQLKQDKVNNYAKRMGITLPQTQEVPQMRNGGTLPKFPTGGRMVNGEWVEDTGNPNFEGDPQATYAKQRYDAMNDKTPMSNISIPVGQGTYSSQDQELRGTGAKIQEVPTSTSYDYKGNSNESWFSKNKDSMYTAGSTLAQSVGQLAYLGEQGKKYDKQEYYNYNPSLLDSSAAINTANQQSNKAAIGVKNASGGNSNTYLSHRQGIAVDNTNMINTIRQNYDNANAGISNRVAEVNLNNRYNVDDINAKNKGQALSNYYNTIGSVGTNVAQGMKDNRANNMDKETMSMFGDVYSNPEFQKFLKSKGYKKG